MTWNVWDPSCWPNGRMRIVWDGQAGQSMVDWHRRPTIWFEVEA